MRKYKFRAWWKSQNKYLLWKSNAEVLAILDAIPYDIGGNEWTDDCIVEQYIGLHDKNGKEIYEGDIVQINMGRLDDDSLLVEYGGTYNYAAFGLTGKRHPGSFGSDPTWDTLNDLITKDCEIVGNIHENPELLKKE